MEGLEPRRVFRPGYAVEYDFFPPRQLEPTARSQARRRDSTSPGKSTERRETRRRRAGIVGGDKRGVADARRAGVYAETERSVYRRADRRSRDEIHRRAVSDVHRQSGTSAPPPREDNADLRLSDYGKRFGLISEDEHAALERTRALLGEGLAHSRRARLKPAAINEAMTAFGENPISEPETIAKLCRRPKAPLAALLQADDAPLARALLEDPRALRQAEIELKYEGYIHRQREAVERMERYEDLAIPSSLNYSRLNSLSTEGREKLERFQPRSLGQASRISGVSPSDISILLVHLRK